MRSRQMQKVDEEAAYEAAQRVVEVHRRLADWLRHGQTLAEIDQFVADTLEDLRAKSCFLGYKVRGHGAFPSHACLSLNDCVVHGTAGYYTKPLKEGDVLKIDIGVKYQGWIGDAAWTYVFGEMNDEVRRLTDAGKEALRRGIEQIRPGNRLIDWARAVQEYVEGECGLHLVRGLGGHGYGRKLHTAPFVSNVVPNAVSEWPDAFTACQPGMLLALEPMVAAGTAKVTQQGNAWPVYTADGSQSVHYEHDVLVTDEGPRVLSEGLDDLEDVIRR